MKHDKIKVIPVNGQPWGRPANPYPQYIDRGRLDKIAKVNPEWQQFEDYADQHQHPFPGATIGDVIEREKVEVVWQYKNKDSGEWITIENPDELDSGFVTALGNYRACHYEIRNAYRIKQQPVSEVNHNILSQPQPEEWSHVDKPDMDKLSKEICTYNCSCKSGDECHPDGALNYIELHESERSWKEDYDHENGQYVNRCHVCGLYFFGHKRRVTCKSCAMPVSEQPEEHSETVEAPILSNFTNSEIGSRHWFNTLIGRVLHVGEFLKDQTPEERTLRIWGQAVYDAMTEIRDYFEDVDWQKQQEGK